MRHYSGFAFPIWLTKVRQSLRITNLIRKIGSHSGSVFKCVLGFLQAFSLGLPKDDVIMEANLTVAAASAVKNSEIQNKVASAVAVKTQDAQKAQGEAAVSLIQQVERLSEQLAKGQIDVQL